VTVGADADGQSPGTGGLEAGGAITAAEAEQPEAGAVALLGVRAVGEDGGDERSGLGADGLRCPSPKPRPGDKRLIFWL
jgi:hypothetical protein